jgi:hypothetical protein
MTRVRRGCARWLMLVAAMWLPASLATAGSASGAPVHGESASRVLETAVTSNQGDTSSGEPEIAVNPTDHDDLFVAFATFPSAGIVTVPPPPHSCGGMASIDRGETWQPAYLPGVLPSDLLPANLQPPIPALDSGCQDGVAAFGPDGTLYAGGDLFYFLAAACGSPESFPLGGHCFLGSGYDPLVRSTDGGHTWSAPVFGLGNTLVAPFPFHPGSGQPLNVLDRPWLVVDQSTGTVYLSSANLYVPNPADHEQFVTAFDKQLHRLGDIYAIDSPDFPEAPNSRGSNIVASHGVLAVAYVTSAHVGGCSVTCLIFETSTDNGKTFTRHGVPLSPDAASQPRPFLAADPSDRDHFALAVFDSTGSENQVYTTGDSGATWDGPSVVVTPQAGAANQSFQLFKPWIAFGPSGRLALMWRAFHTSAAECPTAQQPLHCPYDVWAAFGRDEGDDGAVFGTPMRVSSVTAPYPAAAGGDDFSYVTVDQKYVYVAWGDSRNAVPTAGGVQVWFARIPVGAFLRHEQE